MIHTNETIHHNNQYKVTTSWLFVGGLLLTGIGAAFAPWVWQDGVALQITAPGLAEFVKFLPEVRSGQLQINRLQSLYPLFVVILSWVISIANQELSLPLWLKGILLIGVVPLGLAALSPVWTPEILVAEEFRSQTIIVVIAIGLIVLAPLLQKLPFKALIVIISVANIVALTQATRLFNTVQAAIANSYQGEIILGWGWWLTIAGILLSSLAGLWLGFYHYFSK
ncbi:MAG: hypothetical protein AAF485_13655 [Chloroflexota bacterium]